MHKMSLNTDGQNTFNKNINKERLVESDLQLWMLEDKDFSSFWWAGTELLFQLDAPNICFFLPSQMSRLIYFNESFWLRRETSV